MKTKRESNEIAVSPVVGVMLMLVVTIIIAAVVSAFAGGVTSGTQKAPSVSIDASIANTGSDHSYFDMHVNSVSDPVNTKDLKLITSWKTTDKDPTSSTYNTVITGGNTTVPGVFNTKYHSRGTTSVGYRVMPYGYGPGLNSWGVFSNTTPDMYFGNYTLMPGTTLHAYPVAGFAGSTGSGYGYDSAYNYTIGSSGYYQAGDYDGMQGTLGYNWNYLRPGDVVNVQLIHTPSGKVIFNENVNVKGA